MGIWKYRVELTYMAESEQVPIREENIRTLVIDHDYEEKNMPTMFARLNIDKNVFDKIVLNASNAHMLLTLSKINIDNESNEETIYNSLCEYFIDHDINYNKSIDYDKDEHTKDREDIYTEVSIGLMFIDPINWNKQTVNTTVVDATMMNIVGMFIENTPTLIEPFDYNDTFPQLIIPPKDSLLDVLSFLNNLKVFYETSYRVFFEGDAMYLLSSSGKPIKKKGDTYDTVTFIVFPPDADEASALGMGEDEKAKCYVANINANETDYKIDHDTGKQFNHIQAVINPAIENSMSALASIKDIGNQIKGITESFGKALKDVSKQFESIPSSLYSIKDELPIHIANSNSNSASAADAIQKAIDKIMAMPEEESQDGGGSGKGNQNGGGGEGNQHGGGGGEGNEQAEKTISKKEKDRITTELRSCIVSINTDNGKYSGILGDFSTGLRNSIDILGNIASSGGCLGGVAPTNAKNNNGILKKTLAKIGVDSGNNLAHYGKQLTPHIDTMRRLVSVCDKANSLIAQSGIEEEKVKKSTTTIGISRGNFNVLVDITKTNLGKYAGYINSFANVHETLEPFTKKLEGIQTNLQSIYTDTLTNIATIGKNAEKSIATMVKQASSSIDQLAATGLSFENLGDLTKDIRSIKDIKGIGKLASSFKMDLKLGDRDKGSGTKVVQVDNDNPNILKNLKSDIENSMNKFSLRKQDMDVSVFTLNKRYIIRNYDTHSDKDGTFLLTRRMDMFSREDDKFKCLCQLWFNKIAGETGGTESTGQPTDPELLAKIANDIYTANSYLRNSGALGSGKTSKAEIFGAIDL